jgi:protein phosphatase
MTLASAALSHSGLKRRVNEDSYCARADLGLFVVADGMGGHAAGEVASRVAVDTIVEFIDTTKAADENWTWPFGFEPALGVDGTRLKGALRLANRQISARAAASAELRGMATTAAAVLVRRQTMPQGSSAILPALVAHVGDSRVYRWREGGLERLTRDHSWVEEQITAGTLTALSAREHPWRNLVTRALSGGTDPEADITPLALERGDRILLCSDGLFTVVSDDLIAETLGQGKPGADLDGVCSALVDAANRGGGPDNITVILIDVVSLE